MFPLGARDFVFELSDSLVATPVELPACSLSDPEKNSNSPSVRSGWQRACFRSGPGRKWHPLLPHRGVHFSEGGSP